jgi:hypothetical protein
LKFKILNFFEDTKANISAVPVVYKNGEYRTIIFMPRNKTPRGWMGVEDLTRGFWDILYGNSSDLILTILCLDHDT